MILESIDEIRRGAKKQVLQELKEEYSKNRRILEILDEIEALMV